MKKICTYFYSINEFEKNYGEIVDIEAFFEETVKDFDEIDTLLDKVSISPDEKLVNRIVEYSKL